VSKIKVKIVPASGKPTTVEVEGTAAKLGAVLKKAGYALGSFVAKVNGKAADADTMIETGAEVSLTEKPKGS
jgi:sulfur carrier protein ThiS